MWSFNSTESFCWRNRNANAKSFGKSILAFDPDGGIAIYKKDLFYELLPYSRSWICHLMNAALSKNVSTIRLDYSDSTREPQKSYRVYYIAFSCEYKSAWQLQDVLGDNFMEADRQTQFFSLVLQMRFSLWLQKYFHRHSQLIKIMNRFFSLLVISPCR